MPMLEPLPEFFKQGECRGLDPTIFLGEKPSKVKEAKLFCKVCPIRKLCLEYALDQPVNPTGVWGHTTEKERASMRLFWRKDSSHPGATGTSNS